MIDVDKLIAEHESRPYRFVLRGDVRELPHPSDLSYRQAQSVEDGDFIEVVRAVASDPELAEVLADLPGYALEPIITGWLEHAQVKLGESAASSSS